MCLCVWVTLSMYLPAYLSIQSILSIFLSIYFSIYLYMCNKTYIHILCIYTLQYYNSDMWYLRLHVMGMILGVIEHRVYTEEMVMNHGETNCQISNLVHCSTLLPGKTHLQTIEILTAQFFDKAAAI